MDTNQHEWNTHKGHALEAVRSGFMPIVEDSRSRCDSCPFVSIRG